MLAARRQAQPKGSLRGGHRLVVRLPEDVAVALHLCALLDGITEAVQMVRAIESFFG
jgi:hypothetical protein